MSAQADTRSMDTPAPTASPTNNPTGPIRPKLSFSLDLRIVVVALLLIVVTMLLAWRPWHHSADVNARTVSVTGESTIKSTPDEYGFTPSYEFKDADKAAAIKAAGDKQAALVGKLKAIGVADNHIQTNIDGYQDYNPRPLGINQPTINPGNEDAASYTYTLRLHVTVPTRAQAQKVQDYLATTAPGGAVTPNVQFSETLRKKLEAQARDTATKDARAKADQSAKNLGFRVGSVKSVEDGAGFGGGIMPMQADGKAMTMDGAAASPSIAVQPGENDLSYSVTVVYYIK